ncbi:MAG: glycoside hydrolase family 31 protein, partial [Bacteroidales bacterium]|nr:glycoside hydrolase family 31 protein [Bacteroidales bacterium]
LHRYGATWTGDNAASMDHLRLSVPMSLNLGLSGQFFNGADIGGFAENTTPELFGQWIALGVFYPFSRGHACKGSNDKEPWAFGPEIEKVSQVALNRRYRLLPYLYTLFQEASSTGVPVMRPIFFADIKDTTLRREEQSFLLGKDLMVIPKWAKNPAMPKGIWRNISIAGENSQNDQYQPDVKIREGAIVPVGKCIQNTTEYSTDSLTLIISTNANGFAEGRFYEDAGDGFAYKQGQYAFWTFSASTKNGVVTVKARKSEGRLSSKPKMFKVMLYTKNGVIESAWKKGPVLNLKFR